jgi:hypothetical protein
VKKRTSNVFICIKVATNAIIFFDMVTNCVKVEVLQPRGQQIEGEPRVNAVKQSPPTPL